MLQNNKEVIVSIRAMGQVQQMRVLVQVLVTPVLVMKVILQIQTRIVLETFINL
jgi:hypothetical protein